MRCRPDRRLPPRLPSRDSAQLTLEVVGDTDLSGRVLEVGCGRGGNLWLLHRLLGARHLVGVDLVPRAVAFTRRDTRAEHHLFLAGDAELLPIASASVDVVLSVESSSTYAEPERFFREVARLLRPGGTFLHADLLPTELVAAVRRVCADLGFEETHHRDISANVAASSVLREGRSAFGFDAAPTALDPLDPQGNRYVISRFVAHARHRSPRRRCSVRPSRPSGTGRRRSARPSSSTCSTTGSTTGSTLTPDRIGQAAVGALSFRQ